MATTQPDRDPGPDQNSSGVTERFCLVLQLLIFRAIRVEAMDFTQCVTHGSFSRHWQETLYNMFQFTTLYVVPLLVMSCCYGRILLHIHQQHLRDKGETGPRPASRAAAA